MLIDLALVSYKWYFKVPYRDLKTYKFSNLVLPAAINGSFIAAGRTRFDFN